MTGQREIASAVHVGRFKLFDLNLPEHAQKTLVFGLRMADCVESRETTNSQETLRHQY